MPSRVERFPAISQEAKGPTLFSASLTVDRRSRVREYNTREWALH